MALIFAIPQLDVARCWNDRNIHNLLLIGNVQCACRCTCSNLMLVKHEFFKHLPSPLMHSVPRVHVHVYTLYFQVDSNEILSFLHSFSFLEEYRLQFHVKICSCNSLLKNSHAKYIVSGNAKLQQSLIYDFSYAHRKNCGKCNDSMCVNFNAS